MQDQTHMIVVPHRITFWSEGQISETAKARIDACIAKREGGKIHLTQDGYAMAREWIL